MKVVPFILFLVNLQNIICENTDLTSSKLFVQAYAKKLPKKNVQILISRKFLTPTSNSLITKKKTSSKGYTAFPAIGSSEKRLFHVPDSPYFPLDGPNEQKIRVKKVLPDYLIGAVRRRRSAGYKPVDNKPHSKDRAATVAKVRNTKLASNKTRKTKSLRNKKTKKPKTSDRSRNKTHARETQKSKDRKKNLKTKVRKRPEELKYTPSQPKKNKTKSVKRSRSKSRGEKSRAPKRVRRTRRLIAAKDALIEDYPYVVSIQKNEEHWCAGALLNPTLVITTANCIWKASRVSLLRVRAGSRHADHGGQVAKIQEVIKHPLWSIRRNPDYDIALILLDRKIKFSHSVHGVDLPNRIMLPAFDDAWVTSWGAERRDGVYDKKAMTLQAYHTRLMDRAKCNNVTQRFGVTVTENFICLAQTGRRAPCTRDTGAPAVSDGVLWGLASWGIRKLCGTERFPAMFSYLASQNNMDFILNATHTLMGDQRFYPFPDRYPLSRSKAAVKRPELPLF